MPLLTHLGNRKKCLGYKGIVCDIAHINSSMSICPYDTALASYTQYSLLQCLEKEIVRFLVLTRELCAFVSQEKNDYCHYKQEQSLQLLAGDTGFHSSTINTEQVEQISDLMAPGKHGIKF